jgi:hypothetical protein
MKFTIKIKNFLYALLFMATSSCSNSVLQEGSNVMKLWYDKPAEYFINAMPIGNGRLAATVYGRPSEELIHLNEETLWTGGPVNLNPNPEAPEYVSKIRKALDEKNYALADQLSRKMQGYFSQSYAPVGDLLIRQDYKGVVTDYYRDLDLNTAIATTHFKVGETEYTREAFVSYPDQVIVVKLSSSKPKALNLSISTQSKLHASVSVDGQELLMEGRAPSHADPTYMNTSNEPIQWDDDCKGMRFQTRVKTLQNNGKEKIENGEIKISSASQVTLAISIATSFNGFDKCPMSEGKNEKVLAKSYLENLKNKSYEELKINHLKDYSNYFERAKFYLNGNKEVELLPTDERLQRYQKDNSDHGLEALLYQYGRYLLISSSRKGGIAANLQGKWNVDVRPAWSCNYTTNINLEMNYWGAEKTGLGDMHWPLIQQVINMSKIGKYVAKNFYKCRGWAAGHNSDIWALTNPVGHIGMGDPQWANWIMAGPWLSQHLWEKYAYSGDKEYLRNTAYPVMKEAAEFCLDWLVDDGKGYLITSPSTSPENRYIGEDGRSWAVAKGATMDLALMRNLFENSIEAINILDIDKSFGDTVRATLKRLLPYQVGKDGDLQEWAADYQDSEPTHRHVSHLFCLHPGNDISVNKTPELFEACKKTLLKRGDGGTGWSRVWKVCFWARLLDGNHAYKLLQNDLDYTKERGFTDIGGTYPNLFNACPPFQIDGNFGIVEGISEMLLQSHLKEIYLLPALPIAWKDGSIIGLKARGGFDVDMQWKNGTLKMAVLHSKNDTACRLRTNVPISVKGAKIKTVEETSLAGKTYVNTFEVEKDKQYIINPK